MGAFGDMLVRHSLAFGGQPARRSRQATAKCKSVIWDELKEIQHTYTNKKREAFNQFAGGVYDIRPRLIESGAIKDGATIRDIMDTGFELVRLHREEAFVTWRVGGRTGGFRNR